MDLPIDISNLTPAELELVLAKLAANDFRIFWNYCWPGQAIAKHHYEWHNMLELPGGHEGSKRLLIGAPRGWGKSTWAVRQILFELGRDPNILITIVTADSNLAIDLLKEVSDNIERNENYQRVFPHIKPSEPWHKTRITVERSEIKKDASVRASGLFTTGVGGRSNLMIFDDCTSFRTSVESPQVREMSKRIFYEVWMNYLLPGGRVIYICTPWHVQDLSMEIRSSGAFDEWWVPALDENDESRWPEVWPTEELIKKRNEDPRAFAHQYMLEPIADSDTIFNYDTILMGSGDDVVPGPSFEYYFGVDLAPALGNASNAYSVIFVIGVDSNDPRGVRHVVDIIRARAKAPDFMEMIIDAYNQYKPKCIMVENNGYQQSMIDFLEARNVELPIVGYRTGSQKLDLQTGVPSIAPLLARGLLRYPIDSAHLSAGCGCNFCVWIEELKMYPSGQHSDTVMAMWLAERAYMHTRGIYFDTQDYNVYIDEDFDNEPIDDDFIPEETDADMSFADWL